MLAAILICGSNVFSSCLGSDNPVDSKPASKPKYRLVERKRV